MSITIAAFAATSAGAQRAQPAQPNLFPRAAIESSAAPSRRDAPTPVPIDAAWRAVEHAVVDQFHPNASSVSDGNPLGHLVRQLARPTPPVAPAPPDRHHDDSTLAAPSTPSAAAHAAQHRDDQVERAQQAYEEPASWMVTLVEARLPPDGDGLPEIVVVRGCGRAKLDRLARDAVEAALRLPSARPAGPAIARFRVEAAVSIAMPVKAVVDPVRHRANGLMVHVASGTFGADRPTEVRAPLQPRVRTRVTLVEVLR